MSAPSTVINSSLTRQPVSTKRAATYGEGSHLPEILSLLPFLTQDYEISSPGASVQTATPCASSPADVDVIAFATIAQTTFGTVAETAFGTVVQAASNTSGQTTTLRVIIYPQPNAFQALWYQAMSPIVISDAKLDDLWGEVGDAAQAEEHWIRSHYELAPKGTFAKFARDYKAKLASRPYKKTSDIDLPMIEDEEDW